MSQFIQIESYEFYFILAVKLREWLVVRAATLRKVSLLVIALSKVFSHPPERTNEAKYSNLKTNSSIYLTLISSVAFLLKRCLGCSIK